MTDATNEDLVTENVDLLLARLLAAGALGRTARLSKFPGRIRSLSEGHQKARKALCCKAISGGSNEGTGSPRHHDGRS
jgi:hypothetical protein